MKKLLLFCALLLSLMARAADTPAPAPVPESPLAPLASLVGGLWVGDVPVPKGATPLKLEARFVWTENHRAIHFESVFVTSTKRTPYTSGLYAWDGAKGKLVIFYVNNDGDLTEGVIVPEGETLVNDLTVTEPSGKTYPVRVRLTKVGDDGFNNAIFLLKNNEWVPFVTVKYERQK